MSAFAQSRPWTLDRYQHAAWTSKDGAPTGNKAIVQTTDGFLWIGSDKGLYRYDGSSFQRINELDGVDLSDGLADPLLAGADGSLWVSSDKAGFIEFKDGRARIFTAKDGVKPTWDFKQMALDAEGNPWLVAQYRVLKLENGHWVIQDQDLIDQHIPVVSMFIDRYDGVWAGTADSLYYRAAGRKKFVLLENRGYVLFITGRFDGSVWVSYLKNTVERWNLHADGPVLAPGVIHPSSDGYMVFDQQGGLWLNGLGGGIQHIAGSVLDADPTLSSINKHIESFDKAKGLSGNYVWPSLVDREGNIWFGTNAGVDRFTRSNFAVSQFPESGHYFSLTAGKHDEIFAGSTGAPVMEIDGDHVNKFNIGEQMLASYTDDDDNVYMAGPTGLWEIHNSNAKLLTKILMDVHVGVKALVKDDDGTFWLSVNSGRKSGLYTWRDGKFTPVLARAGDASTLLASSDTIFKDRQGRLWLGEYEDRNIVLIDHGAITFVGASGVKNVGLSPSFAQNSQKVWVGGSEALGYLDGTRVRVIHFKHGQRIKNITGLAFALNGDLWVHALEGVYRIDANDIHHAQIDPSFVVSYRKFDALDGVLGAPAPYDGHPTVVRTTDGRLWFSSSDGVTWLDPSQLIANPVPPPVVINTIEADGKPYSVRDQSQLPPATQAVRLTFSVPSLTIPKHVRVKVRLRGLDDTWRDVGTQREVTYNNLLPNTYHFDVIAANNSGVWNNVGASVAFTVLPTFYQTVWFKLICAALAALILWIGFVWRLRQLQRRALIKIEAQHAERERIARDLHDTLLQRMQGVLMRVDFWAKRADLSEGQRTDAALIEELMRTAISEGRDSIKALRLNAVDDRDFISAISIMGEHVCSNAHLRFTMRVLGQARPVSLRAFDETVAIVREAVANACVHAKAESVGITVNFSVNALQLDIKDDGIGMTEEHRERRQRDGHWGIKGMQERAKRLSGRCVIDSTLGIGTVVSLWIPRKSAFE